MCKTVFWGGKHLKPSFSPFLGFKLLPLLQTRGGGSSPVHHPCYPQQFNTEVRWDSLDSPCTSEYRPARFDRRENVTVVGTGDYDRCLDNVKMMFSFSNCSFSKCSFNGVFQPSVRGRFMVGPLDLFYPSMSRIYEYLFVKTLCKNL